ncbi:MAG: hypothetical protein S4CHLAM6_07360 [Chlamydiae bacterium]|nr:hypothetical protein [Chlamydiota bacterium]
MEWIALLLIVSILIIFIVDCVRCKITPTPSSKKVRLKVLEILPKTVDGVILELGSGFGQMALDLSKHFPKNSVMSFEKAYIPYFIQRFLLMRSHAKNITLFFKDFKKRDFSNSGLIFCYLYRSIMPELMKKIRSEAQKPTWVISHTFAIDELKPIKTAYANDLYNTPIYLYLIRPQEYKKHSAHPSASI